MAIRRKKEGEYHTGRLNISCKGTVDMAVADDLRNLRELEGQIDVVLKETVEAVKMLKAQGK